MGRHTVAVALLTVTLPGGRTLVAQAQGATLIEGVPPIGWAAGRYSHHIAALQGALHAMGCSATYEELMVMSGAGFRTAWCIAEPSYSVTCVYPADEDYVLIGAASVGATAERRSFADAQEARRAVLDSIRRGIPVVAWENAGAQVICGCDADGRRLYVQSCNSPDGKYQLKALNAFPAPQPYSTPNEVVLLAFEPGNELPELDWVDILRRAVRFADYPPDQRLPGEYVVGLAAYDAWGDSIRSAAAAGTISALAPEVTEAQANTLADARSSVAKVLREYVLLHEALVEAADFYDAEAEVLKGIPSVLSGGQDNLSWAERTAVARRRLADPQVANEIADMIDAAKWEEAGAVDALRRVLAEITPEEPERTTADSQPAEPEADPQALYERGLQLKRAGRFTEAASALRAALKAQPDHIDAHWALGWVLIELKDAEGAVAEFRRVVELEPGSDRAKEAQQAIQRLGQ